MAEFDKIDISNNTIYVKDSTARTSIATETNNRIEEDKRINVKIEGIENSTNTQINELENSTNTQINELEKSTNTQINELKKATNTQINELENKLTTKRCIFISDSYGTTANSWIDYAVELLHLSEGNYYKNSLGGAGFKPSYNSYFITLLKNIENSVTDKGTISDIIVGGGFNDRNTAISEIQTAINEFCTYCKAVYPHAKVWIGAFGWSFNYEFLNELKNGRYIQAYKTCGLYGANYLSGSDFIMHSTTNFKAEGKGEYTLYLDYQYVHPNERGAKLIAACVMNNLNGAPFHYYEKLDPINIEPNTAEGVSFVSNKNNINEIINDDLISYWLDMNINIHWNTPMASSGTKFIEIGTIKTGAIAGVSLSGSAQMGFMALGFIFGGEITENTPVPVYIMIANSRIYAQLLSIKKFDTLFLLNARGEINNIFA